MSLNRREIAKYGSLSTQSVTCIHVCLSLRNNIFSLNMPRCCNFSWHKYICVASKRICPIKACNLQDGHL